ncbi:60S ribosomal protein L7-2, putative [Hepatocystis sp. ex Piliocolobus tephrosceles]|nr:60S ribosomal protein L7-2, putative [Hepatocystis sp. ex Piliocolobus tephrosceles]
MKQLNKMDSNLNNNKKDNQGLNKPQMGKRKTVKFTRIKKVNFKKEKKLFVPNETKDKQKSKKPNKKKFKTAYRKMEYSMKLENQKKEFLDLQKQLKNTIFKETKRCIFAIRNKTPCIYHKANDVLQKLRLNKYYKGVLLVDNVDNMRNLFLVKPYICYGYIQKYNCYTLLEKRLFLKKDDEIIRCSSNAIISKLFTEEKILTFSSFCEYIYECKKCADNIMKQKIMPFDFSDLNDDLIFDFKNFNENFIGFLDDRINEILEKII